MTSWGSTGNAGTAAHAPSTPNPAANRAGPIWRHLDGQQPYDSTLAAMAEHTQALRNGTAPEAIWLLEHAPIYTGGTSARPEDLINPQSPIPALPTGRGGQWTYHGPGQRVAYVMLDLSHPHGTVPARDIRGFVDGLQAWGQAALAQLGITATPRPGRVGLWVPRPDGRDDKIMALGVRVSRWISSHGIAINLDPNLDAFNGIIPCGISEHGVTSLRALGSPATLADLDTALATTWATVFGT